MGDYSIVFQIDEVQPEFTGCCTVSKPAFYADYDSYQRNQELLSKYSIDSKTYLNTIGKVNKTWMNLVYPKPYQVCIQSVCNGACTCCSVLIVLANECLNPCFGGSSEISDCNCIRFEKKKESVRAIIQERVLDEMNRDESNKVVWALESEWSKWENHGPLYWRLFECSYPYDLSKYYSHNVQGFYERHSVVVFDKDAAPGWIY
mmetsp:Transcript_13651/g.16935  ORF Transcript_13651/g.16935 Transcript_13651/m.16935 type:complete len:204 (+) Transcript_13651:177-788(+)